MNTKIKRIVIKPATQKDKKLQAKIEYNDGKSKTIAFGAEGFSDFTLHKDVQRKNLYLKRHSKDPTNIDSAGGLARDVLWSKPTLSQAVQFAANKHNVPIKLSK